ncbi:MAG: glutathione peroxidase [Cellvibrionaceae bacterium]
MELNVNKVFLFALATIVGAIAVSSFTSRNAIAEDSSCPSWLNHSIKKLHSADMINVCEVTANKPILLVNTASHCGFTYQFGGLEKLHQRYKNQGLVVLGFPSNAFHQEAKDSAETASVCYKNYGVTFLMTEEIPVKGDNAHPIFQHLASQQSKPSWNFNKYLVDKNGNVIKQFSSQVKPESVELTEAIEEIL